MMLAAHPAEADDKAAPATDKSAFTLFAPTPEAALRAFSPDRPTKITGPFTVDAGHFQVESDLGVFTHADVMGVTTRTFQTLDPTLKLGVLNNVDLEVTWNGLEFVHQSTDGVAHSGMRFTGAGDVFLRAKINLLGNDGGDFAFAIIPYVKLPSSTPASLAIGNNAVETGGLATLQITLPQDFLLTLQTEVDALKGGNDARLHPNFVNIANLQHPVPGIKNLTVNAEIFTSVSTDRFTPNVYTLDFALAYLLRPTTQLDIGANFGLNRAAPDLQIYGGVAQRF